jgi:ribosomal protein S18 acetylase RimI-like enzyme
VDDIADDLVRFWTAHDVRLEHVEPTWWGAVVTDGRFPDVWDTNYARVETGDRSVRLEEITEALMPALEAANAAAVHVVMFRPHATGGLLDELAARGDVASWDVVMVHTDEEASPTSSVRVEELPIDGHLWSSIESSLPAFGVTEAAATRQLVRIEREVLDPGRVKRWFGVRDPSGEAVALGALVALAGLGYVDNVVTLPHARGLGYARAVVSRIVREARAAGLERTFLLAEPQGPVALYEGLGFREATRIASTLSARHVGGGGR